MNCRTCQAAIPDHWLGKECPDCTAAHARAALLEHQKTFLPKILKGDLKLTRSQRGNHLILADDRYHAWCGEKTQPNRYDHQVNFPVEGLAAVCHRCREVFEELMKGAL